MTHRDIALATAYADGQEDMARLVLDFLEAYEVDSDVLVDLDEFVESHLSWKLEEDDDDPV